VHSPVRLFNRGLGHGIGCSGGSGDDNIANRLPCIPSIHKLVPRSRVTCRQSGNPKLVILPVLVVTAGDSFVDNYQAITATRHWPDKD
jgi:hypothetical protein